jgi:hypothetical protein
MIISHHAWPILVTRWSNLEPKVRSNVILGNQGATLMRDYRAYILGVEGHRFVRVKDFSNDQLDDAAALSAAKKLVDGHEVELWDCGRLVALLSSDGEVVSPELAPVMSSSAPFEREPNLRKSPASPVHADPVSEAVAAKNPLLLGW